MAQMTKSITFPWLLLSCAAHLGPLVVVLLLEPCRERARGAADQPSSVMDGRVAIVYSFNRYASFSIDLFN